MAAKVIFYVLGQKFLERESDLPVAAPERQVIYQTLALGHHVGVIDCLKSALECPYEGYCDWVNALPDTEARRKLAGLMKFGEITIDVTHAAMLRDTLEKAGAALPAEARAWNQRLLKLLRDIQAEPAMYLMVKRRES